MTRNIQIIKALPADNRKIEEVFYKTWLATYPNEEFGITVDDIEDMYKDRFTEERLEKSLHKLENLPEGHTLLTAKEGDQVIGVCRIVLKENENRLQAIYVLPEYQGQGVGWKLWEEARKIFDPSKDISVDLVTYNTKAFEFYKKLGFEDTGKRWDAEQLKFKSGNMFPEMQMVIKATS